MDSQHPDHVYNEYKTRNILRLADRVQVLREYDSYPTKRSYQSLATMFDCSAKQIKNILLSREDILKAYEEAGNGSSEELRDEGAARKRQEKIDFLAKVLFEYIQRVVYYNYRVDEEKVRQKALQIKECIAIENFQLNNGWFNYFKTMYEIPGFDMASLHNNVRVLEEKKPHLSAIDMIQYVSKSEQKSRKLDMAIRKRKRGRPSNFEKLQWQSQAEMKPDIVYETGYNDYADDDNEYAEANAVDQYNDEKEHASEEEASLRPMQSTTFHDHVVQDWKKPKPKTAAIAMYSQHPSEKRKRAESPVPDINSPAKALKHVKALEEYAMLQDNFRAIGLLEQLERIFEQKSKAV